MTAGGCTTCAAGSSIVASESETAGFAVQGRYAVLTQATAGRSFSAQAACQSTHPHSRHAPGEVGVQHEGHLLYQPHQL